MAIDKPEFSGTTAAIGHIYNVLKAIIPVSPRVTLTMYEGGIKFSANSDANACQAHLFIMRDLFLTFNFNAEDYVSINVSLKAFVQCLQMFVNKGQGGEGEDDVVASTCSFFYEGEGTPFILFFKEGYNLITKCELATFVSDEVDEEEIEEPKQTLELMKDDIVMQIITRGDLMFDAIKELETMKTDIVTIIAQSLVAPHFQLLSESETGQTKISFPNEQQVMETFVITDGELHNVIVKNAYQFRLIAKVIDALGLATRVSIRCDSSGTMSIQSMCQIDHGKQSFIDFRFQPNEN